VNSWWMYPLGAVFAPDADTARRMACELNLEDRTAYHACIEDQANAYAAMSDGTWDRWAKLASSIRFNNSF
jgi:hypothetical protein